MGKNLVKELKLDPGIDTFSRWMAHYIAEQMEIAKNETGDAKAEAEQQCFTTILRLWGQRSSWPRGHRPFVNFEPVFRALERLDPENPNPYYYSSPIYRSSEADDSVDESDEVKQWLDNAFAIDQTARIWLEYVFYQASLKAIDAKTITWLENALGLPEDHDASIIVRLLDADADNESENTADQEQQTKREKIESRIKQLDAYVEFNQNLRDAYVTELETMAHSDSSTDVVDTV